MDTLGERGTPGAAMMASGSPALVLTHPGPATLLLTPRRRKVPGRLLRQPQQRLGAAQLNIKYRAGQGRAQEGKASMQCGRRQSWGWQQANMRGVKKIERWAWGQLEQSALGAGWDEINMKGAWCKQAARALNGCCCCCCRCHRRHPALGLTPCAAAGGVPPSAEASAAAGGGCWLGSGHCAAMALLLPPRHAAGRLRQPHLRADHKR